MAILQAGIIAPSGGYQISRSLRFNSADSAYLNRTFTTPTSGNIFTWSGWVKRGTFGTAAPLFGPSYAGGEGAYFNTSNQFQVAVNGAVLLASTPVYRDPSAWYHVVMVSDMGNATASLRFRVYINGVEITSWATDARSSYTSFPYWNKNTVVHYLGYSNGTSTYLDGYLTEINFIDGQALTPSSFGQTNASTGVWEPIRYTGTYGTNGFYLNFSDNSNTTAATLGKDSSGNGNNWTPNNFSVTAGAGNDSLVDTPTPYGTDTGVGGEVRGNYATLNPLAAPAVPSTFSNGNLTITTASTGFSITSASMAMRSGKWYCEIKFSSLAIGAFVGIRNSAEVLTSYVGGTSGSYGYYSTNGNKYNAGTATAYGSSYTTAHTIGIAFDADAGTLTFYRDNVSQGVAYSSISAADYVFAISDEGTGSVACDVNFGQRPFAYTAPSGFKALCTQNLPTPTIGATSTTRAGKYFNTVLLSGNGSAGSVTGVGFQPDFIWAKNRTNAYNHELWDAIRGVNSTLFSNSTAAEDTTANRLVSFNSDGFSYGTSSNLYVNATNSVAWNWNAGGSNATNTNGTITSTVRANTTAGFSIVTYTGTGANATVGHGLGVAPSMVIVKCRNQTNKDWTVWHTSLTSAVYAVFLNATNAQTSDATYWNSTAPSSTVFSVGSNNNTNVNTGTFVAYCFAAVAGYSAFGSYTGNGSTDGPFVYTGFRPRFILIKCSSNADYWWLKDSARNTYNLADLRLAPNFSDAEANDASLNGADFLSNGFKLRGTDTTTNGSTRTYIYAAFASNPFKFSLAG